MGYDTITERTISLPRGGYPHIMIRFILFLSVSMSPFNGCFRLFTALRLLREILPQGRRFRHLSFRRSPRDS